MKVSELLEELGLALQARITVSADHPLLNYEVLVGCYESSDSLDHLVFEHGRQELLLT